MFSKKKGQISIEALILVGVLVIGGVIFASIFLGQINTQTKTANELSGITDGFMNDLSGWDNTGTGGNTGTGTGTDTNGEDENGEVLPGTLIIYLSLSPIGSTPINTNFGVKVDLNNQTGETNAVIKEINIRDSDNESTTNCSYNNQTPASIYTGLNVSFTNNSTILNLNCSVEGEYRIYVKAGISGVSTYDYMNPQGILKIITPTPTSYALSLKITSPLQDGMYIINDNINLNSEISITPTPVNTPTYSCLWKDEMGSTLSTVCSGGSVPASDLNVGSKKIKLFVTADVGDPIARGLSGNFETTIHIINPLVADQLYLSVPNKTYSGNLFNIKVYSTSEYKVNAIKINNHFNFTNTNCKVIGSIDTVSQTTLGHQTIYYKDFPTDCSLPSYSSCPATLEPIKVNTTSGSATGVFTSEFDLRFNSAVCNTGASDSGGLLKACVFSDSGIAFNDFCSNLNYGLLKITVNLAENTVSNNNGELKIYIK